MSPEEEKEKHDKQLEYCREYHKRTYQDRKDEKNRKLRERRRQQNWYQQNAERIKADRRRWYQENKEEALAKARERERVIRQMVLAHYGGKCACCGETEYKFLALDHINGGGNKHRKALGISGKSVCRWIIKNNYPDGFQVLCHNCNVAKGLYGNCPHKEGF